MAVSPKNLNCDMRRRFRDNFETVRDRMSILITNRKLHTGFRLLPTTLTSVTSNDLERRNSTYFSFFFTEFNCFADQLRHSAWRSTVCRISSSTFGQNWLTLQRRLCHSWATCQVDLQSRYGLTAWRQCWVSLIIGYVKPVVGGRHWDRSRGAIPSRMLQAKGRTALARVRSGNLDWAASGEGWGQDACQEVSRR